MKQINIYYFFSVIMSTPPRRLKTNRETPEDSGTRQPKLPPITHQRKNKDCRYCDQEHPLRKCFRFRRLSIQDRLKVVRKFGYCFNCLAHSHLVKNCTSRDRCKVCRDEHHTLLHREHQRVRPKNNGNRPKGGNQRNRRNSYQHRPLPQSNEIIANSQATSSSGAPTIVINVTSKP